MANTKINVVVFDLGGVLIEMVSGWGHAHRLANLDKNLIDSLPGDFEQKRKSLAKNHQNYWWIRLCGIEKYSKITLISVWFYFLTLSAVHS